jgi:HSP20 family molecular chaperone IbpA
MSSKIDTTGTMEGAQELALQEVERTAGDRPVAVHDELLLESQGASLDGREGDRVRPSDCSSMATIVSPPADIAETDEVVLFSIELPGMSEKDVEVQISPDLLVIRGVRRSDDPGITLWHLRERSTAIVERMILIPDGVDTEDWSMQFRDGVLTVRMAKSCRQRKKRRVYAS